MLAILIFAVIPLACVFNVIRLSDPKVLVAVSALCICSLIGALAGAFKVDDQVTDSEARLSQNQRQVRLFIDRIHDGLFQVNPSGTILQINKPMAQFLGCDPGSLNGRNLWDFLIFQDGPPDLSFIPPEQERRSVVVLAKVEGGGQVELLTDFYRRDEGEKFTGFIGCAHLVRRSLTVEKLREHAALAVCLRLKTALQDFIQDAGKALASSPNDPAAAFAALENKVNQFSDSLAVYLETKTLQSWKPKLRLETVHPEELIEGLKSRYEPAARLHHHRMNFQLLSEPTPFTGDAHYLAEMLGNLIEDALKYTPADGQIDVTYRGTDHELRFTVSDNGGGMRNDQVSRIFSPFFQGANGVNTHEEGLGLGLWSARRIAEAHQGLLTVNSEPGEGSDFTFILSRKEESKPAAKSPAA